jgi:hypothetical protein
LRGNGHSSNRSKHHSDTPVNVSITLVRNRHLRNQCWHYVRNKHLQRPCLVHYASGQEREGGTIKIGNGGRVGNDLSDQKPWIDSACTVLTARVRGRRRDGRRRFCCLCPVSLCALVNLCTLVTADCSQGRPRTLNLGT